MFKGKLTRGGTKMKNFLEITGNFWTTVHSIVKLSHTN